MIDRRDFVKSCVALIVAPDELPGVQQLLPGTPPLATPADAAPYMAFKLNDCDYIAARSVEEAKAFYGDWCGVDVEEVEVASLGTPFWDGEPGDESVRRLTFAQSIAEEMQAGETGAFYLATDGHYC